MAAARGVIHLFHRVGQCLASKRVSKRRGDVAVGGEGRDQDVHDPEGDEEPGAGKGEWSVATQLGRSAEQDQGDCDDGEDGEDEHLWLGTGCGSWGWGWGLGLG